MNRDFQEYWWIHENNIFMTIVMIILTITMWQNGTVDENKYFSSHNAY